VDFFTFDDEYLRRLASGDRVTVDHFVRYFEKYLLIKLRQRLRSMQAIEDVRQEVFLRVFAALRSENGIREGSKLGPFVNGVSNNVLREWYRADGRTEPLDETFDVADPHDLPDGKLATEETNAAVRGILDDMPRKDADILRARFLQERGMDEISRDFNVDRGYLRVLLHRAKNRFRSRFPKPRKPENTPPGKPPRGK
jgi:RNA polymerase sigma-70 factor (ECF subfamily)